MLQWDMWILRAYFVWDDILGCPNDGRSVWIFCAYFCETDILGWLGVRVLIWRDGIFVRISFRPIFYAGLRSVARMGWVEFLCVFI